METPQHPVRSSSAGLRRPSTALTHGVAASALVSALFDSCVFRLARRSKVEGTPRRDRSWCRG